jgi:hypothetical protein
MPLQFVCPFCNTNQMAPDQAAGQKVSCAKCGKAVKIAASQPPLARPVPLAAPVAGRPVTRRRKSNRAIYVVAGVVALTIITGISLAIFYWPGREPAPQPRPQAKAAKPKTDTESKKATPAKQIEPPPEPDPEPDADPPPPILERTLGEWYLDGAEPKVRIDFKSIDPDETVKDLKVIVWTGDMAAPKAASWRSPQVRSGDSPRQEAPVAYKNGRGTVEVPLPPLPKDKVYWLQPTLVDGDGKRQWLAVEPWEPAAPPLERRPALLQHKIEPGRRSAQLNSQATVTVRDGTDTPFVFNIGVRADLTERVKAAGDAASLSVEHARVQFEFAQDGLPALVERVLGTALEAASKVKSSWRLDSAGTVSKRTVNLDDIAADVRKDVIIFDERLAHAFELANLHLPNREVKALESWTHKRTVGKSTLELTAVYEGRRKHQHREEAYLSLRGTIKGGGKQKEGKVEGAALVDLVGGLVMKAELKLEAEIVVPYLGIEIRGPGVLEVRLTRQSMR